MTTKKDIKKLSKIIKAYGRGKSAEWFLLTSTDHFAEYLLEHGCRLEERDVLEYDIDFSIDLKKCDPSDTYCNICGKPFGKCYGHITSMNENQYPKEI